MKHEIHEERLHMTIAIVLGVALVSGFVVSLGRNQESAGYLAGDLNTMHRTDVSNTHVSNVQIPSQKDLPPAPSSPPAVISFQNTDAAVSANTLITHVKIVQDARYGNRMTDLNGRALYTTSKPSCTDACLAAWPPYLVEPQNLGLAGRLMTIARADTGAMQFAWNGKFLYYYAGDRGSSVTGDGFGGVWSVARP